jgi:hypothetical protein
MPSGSPDHRPEIPFMAQSYLYRSQVNLHVNACPKTRARKKMQWIKQKESCGGKVMKRTDFLKSLQTSECPLDRFAFK